MSFSLWSLLIAGLLPYITVGIAKGSTRGYDNARPRDWAASLTDWRRRAHAAHANHFEFLPFYTAAVLVAQIRLGPNASVDLLAGGVILARIAYTIAYLLDRPALRSIVWLLAIAGIATMFVLAARGP